ncbi:MAG: RNA polymerase sigma factor [Chloroflexaceae bacterium]
MEMVINSVQPQSPHTQSMQPVVSSADQQMVVALRAGDETAFTALHDQYHAAMIRLAQLYVSSQAVAEEVVQETWVGVLRGLERFEGRSSLKTWIFRILVNRARTRGAREGRSITFSDLWHQDIDPVEAMAELERYPADAVTRRYSWTASAQGYAGRPEEHFLSKETCTCIQEAIAALQPSQRTVITLRDIEGWSSAEVCTSLGISESNQRVLLHRARTRVRRTVEAFLAEA